MKKECVVVYKSKEKPHPSRATREQELNLAQGLVKTVLEKVKMDSRLRRSTI